MSDNTALVQYSKVVDPIQFAERMAMAYGGACGARSKEEGAMVAMQCLLEGITPLAFQAKYHLIMGKPSKKATAMRDDFVNRYGGTCVVQESTPEKCTIYFKDKHGNEFTHTYTRRDILLSRWPWDRNPGWQKNVEEVRSRFAKGESDDQVWLAMAKYYKDNWGTEMDWENMMVQRRLSASLDKICPEAKGGFYTDDEVEMIEAIDGEIVHEKPAPPTASEFIKQAQATSTVAAISPVKPAEEPPFETAVEAEVIEAEFELGEKSDPAHLTPGQERLIAKCMEQFNQAFGEKSQQALANALSQRKVAGLFQLPEEELQVISDRLTAKIAQLAPKN